MSVLIVDIGNTWTKIAVYREGKLIKVRSSRMEPLKFIKIALSEYGTSDFYVSTVRPVEEIREIVPENMENKRILSHHSQLPLEVMYETPETLGRDRIASTVGAYTERPGENHLVIDAGTCITYDWVNSEGKYLGGNIAPGLKMRLKAMDEFTHLLPYGQAYEPLELMGKSTHQALYNGAAWGVLNEIKSYILSTGWEPLNVWITGGDGKWISKNMQEDHRYSSVLLLKGLYEIYRINNN